MQLFPKFIDQQLANVDEPEKVTEAPFFCDFYDVYECKSCKPVIKQCQDLHYTHVNSCYALWTQSENQSKSLISKGCWSFPQTTRMCLPLIDRCAVDQSTSRYDINGDELFICCCEHSKCNIRYERDASLRPKSSIELPAVLVNETSSYQRRTKNLPRPLVSPTSPTFLTTPIILLCSLIIVGVAAVALYSLYRLWRQKHRAQNDMDNGDDVKSTDDVAAISSSSNLWWTLKAWRALLRHPGSNGKRWRRSAKGNGGVHVASNKAYVKLEEKFVVAEGRYGKVYAVPSRILFGANDSAPHFLAPAALAQFDPIAVKVFDKDDAASWANERDIYRIKALTFTPNVLQFLDARKNGPEFWLLSEYHTNGSVHSYLKKNTLNLHQLLHISTSMLAGLAFLHEEILTSDEQRAKPTIVHRDFKSMNVLLKNDLTACIADFGLAVKCEQGYVPRDAYNQVGTHRYMAPEVLEGATEQSAPAYKQIDVYAAALVLWELLSRCKADENITVEEYRLPFEIELSTEPSSRDFSNFVAIEKRRPSFRIEYMNDNVCRAMTDVIADMWNQEPEARITAHCALNRARTLQLRCCVGCSVASTAASDVASPPSLLTATVAAATLNQSTQQSVAATNNRLAIGCPDRTKYRCWTGPISCSVALLWVVESVCDVSYVMYVLKCRRTFRFLTTFIHY